MRLQQLSHLALLALYDAGAAVLVVFGVLYAVALAHGWDSDVVLALGLILGAASALLVWAFLEPAFFAAGAMSSTRTRG